VFRLISWKQSFRRLGEEFEVAKKKKRALDSLLSRGKISQATYDVFNHEIEEALTEIERQQQALQEKMTAKADEVEGQIKTLEMLLANFEIQHVTGEVDDDVYERQVDLLSVGLENARQELDMVRDANAQLSSGNVAIPLEPEELEPVEVPKDNVEVVEVPVVTLKDKMPEPPAEAQADEAQPAETANAEISEEKQEK
jgi:hypothetical protein